MTRNFGRRMPAPVAPRPVMGKFSRPEKEAQPSTLSVDDEIRQWKKARGFHFPIRLLALVACLSFGIGSLVLPTAVNDWAQGPLLALSAASLYAGLRRKRKS